jgi:hypothetical protein
MMPSIRTPTFRLCSGSEERTMRMQRMLPAAALGLLLAAGPAAAGYTFTTIDVPHSGSTAVNGNSANAAVGEFTDAAGATHGFVLSTGVFTQIDFPGANTFFTSVNGINAKGDTKSG